MKSCSLVIDTEKQLIKDILINKNVGFADKTVDYIINNLKLDKIDKEVLAFREKLKKPIKEYKKLFPHVAAAKKIIDLGGIVREGDMISYYIAEGSGSVNERAEPYFYVEDYYPPKPDFDYYITNFLLPMRDNLFKASGVTKGEFDWYHYYLKTFHWGRLRYEALENAEYKCQVCSSPTELEVHHNTYSNLWNEPLCDLVVLCSKHHGLIHMEGGVGWLEKRSLPLSV